jgi:hypothetical protein
VQAVPNFEGLDGGITREVVIHAVHELADVYTPEDAKEFERWARLHIVDPDPALWAWQLIFTHWFARPDGDAPEAVGRERPFLDARLGPAAADALQRRVRELAPDPTEEELEAGSDVPREAGVLQEAIEREHTLECLRRLRARTSGDELEAIAAWGEATAARLRFPDAMGARERLAAALRGDVENRPFESALELAIPQRPPSAAR